MFFDCQIDTAYFFWLSNASSRFLLVGDL